MPIRGNGKVTKKSKTVYHHHPGGGHNCPHKEHKVKKEREGQFFLETGVGGFSGGLLNNGPCFERGEGGTEIRVIQGRDRGTEETFSIREGKGTGRKKKETVGIGIRNNKSKGKSLLILGEAPNGGGGK